MKQEPMRDKVLTGLPVAIHSQGWGRLRVHQGLSAGHSENPKTLSLLEPEWSVRKKEWVFKYNKELKIL